MAFSLSHILIVSAFGADITIVHGDCEATAVDDRGGVLWRASSCLIRRLLRRKIAFCYHTYYTEASQDLPRQPIGIVLTKSGHVLFLMEFDAKYRHG